MSYTPGFQCHCTSSNISACEAKAIVNGEGASGQPRFNPQQPYGTSYNTVKSNSQVESQSVHCGL